MSPRLGEKQRGSDGHSINFGGISKEKRVVKQPRLAEETSSHLRACPRPSSFSLAREPSVSL